MPVTTERLCLALALVALASPARAGDGVFEINQTCATTTGCFPGDGAGFPVTIESDGAYQLTSELTLATANQTAIQVSTSDPPVVTIDLRGFAITGVTTCTGEPAVCSGTGLGYGIRSVRDITVRNGTVRGMGDVGVQVGAGSTIEDMLITQNGGDGVRITTGGSRRSIVRGNRIWKNGGEGLSASWQDGDGNYAGTIVYGNVAAGNGSNGLRPQGAAVTGNVAVNNLLWGLSTLTSSGYADNLFFGNKGGNVAADQVNSGLQIGGNVCSGVACP